jgi:hypothetical protein
MYFTPSLTGKGMGEGFRRIKWKKRTFEIPSGGINREIKK